MIRFYIILHFLIALFLIYAGFAGCSEIINSDAEGFTFWIVLFLSTAISLYGAYKIIWLIQHRYLWNQKE
jgi:hypothetical protein